MGDLCGACPDSIGATLDVILTGMDMGHEMVVEGLTDHILVAVGAF